MLATMPAIVMLEANDSRSAETFLRRYHPDLVLVDGDLPGSDSIELVRSIQLDKPRTCCLILANTVFQQAAALEAGADRSPLKGEPAARVFAQVEQLLDPSRLRPAAT
jgi:DNA-binding NarL/FixJ family response regulator